MCVFIYRQVSVFFLFRFFVNLKIDSTFQIDAIICIWCNVIWYRRFVAALVLIWRLAESDITVMPCVMRMD